MLLRSRNSMKEAYIGLGIAGAFLGIKQDLDDRF